VKALLPSSLYLQKGGKVHYVSRLALIAAGLLCLSTLTASRRTLSISPSNPSIQVGQSIQLQALSDGSAEAAKWSISDPLVATLSADGLVTGRSAGKTVVRAQFKNDRAETTVTVIAPDPAPSNSSISAAPNPVQAGQIVTATFTIASPNTYDWVAVAQAGSDPATYLSWKYASTCTQTVGSARTSGSCDFTAPAAGSYEFRLFPSTGWVPSAIGAFTVDTAAPDPPAVTEGPQPTITCPTDAIAVAPNSSIQAAIDGAPSTATLCLRVGVHALSGSLAPKSGMTLIGEYGAILDGTGWSTSDETAAAFRCTAATGVTIRNLTIRNMPKKGVYTDPACEHWTLEHNRIEQTQWGVRLAGSPVTLRRNILYGNGRGVSGGNYSIYMTRNPVLIEFNEIAYGGDQQKAMNTAAVTWRGNWVHHNDYAGIWNDGEGNGSVLEQNTIEDNAGPGIMWELSYGGTIRQNIIRRSGDQAVYVSTSRDTLIDGNTLEDNWRGVTLYLSCPSLTQGWPWNPDLANNTIRGNLTAIGTRQESIGALLAYSGECSSTQVAPYLSNAKNNRFEANRYAVPSLSGSWWLWNGWQNWAAWQGLGHDVAGSVGLR
jgi:parallel beta-helix repeat protein